MNPGVSDTLVVIPCLNEEAHLPELLSVLLEETESFLVVVVDGGSRDASRRIISEFSAIDNRVVLLDNPKRTQAPGINLAARLFGDGRHWLVRMDAHASYPKGYVRRLVETATRMEGSSIVVPMITRGVGCFQRAAAAAQNSRLGTGGAAHRHVSVGKWVDHGHHALFTLRTFQMLNGYNETFSHNEDAEFDLRQIKAGIKIWLEPSLALHYSPRSTPAALARQYYAFGIGRCRTFQLHRSRLRTRQLLPLVVLPGLALALLGFAAMPFSLLFGLFAAPAAVCLLGSTVLGKYIGLK